MNNPDASENTNTESTSEEHTVTSRPKKAGVKSVSFFTRNWRPSRLSLPRGERRGAILIAAAFVAIALLGGFVGGYAGSRNSNGLVGSSLSGQKKIVSSQSQLISQIARKVGPSVVSVNVSINNASPSPFGGSPQTQEAAGTGIIISAKGLIVTNRHVVPDGTTKVSVTLSDGTELKNVSVVGRTGASDSLDIAFLKINDTKGHNLTPAAIGDSANVQVGDDVIAIGNALGQFQNTVTSGIISGFARSVQASSGGGSDPFTGSTSATENLDNLFQTDAAINEGNSGGPLVNLNGQVIGINTAIAGNAQNIGFSIPINDVKGLINQVLDTGKFERAFLGVHYALITPDIADQYKLSVQNGAFIVPAADPSQPSVVTGSPAEQAGLQEKDIITQVDKNMVDKTHSLTSLLDQYQPGDKITLSVIRDGKSQKVVVTLAALPAN
ncbi:MAG: trypsin-like peptidase domain-containing protein [Candidatus Saccharibacteria bacterium]